MGFNRSLLAGLATAFAAGGSALAYSGGVTVAAGDVNGYSDKTSADRGVEAIEMRWGPYRSAIPPKDRGAGTVEITLAGGDSGQLGQDGADLLIVNNGDGSDFLLEDVEILSFTSSARGGAALVSFKSFKRMNAGR